MISRWPSRASALPPRFFSSVKVRAVLAGEDVEPAADVERGHGDVREAFGDRKVSPELIAGGMGEDLRPPRPLLLQQRPDPDGQLGQMRVRVGGHAHQAHQRLGVTGARGHGPLGAGQGHQRRPGLDGVQRQGAPFGVPGRRVVIRGGDRGRDRLQVIAGGCARPLDKAQVRRPEGADVAIAPGLLQQPGHGVGTVAGLVDHGGELPAGPERAPAVLVDHGIPGFDQREDVRDQPIGIKGDHVLAVREAHQQHRSRPASRDPHVRGQPDAVAHRHHDVFFDAEAHRRSSIAVTSTNRAIPRELTTRRATKSFSSGSFSSGSARGYQRRRARSTASAMCGVSGGGSMRGSITFSSTVKSSPSSWTRSSAPT